MKPLTIGSSTLLLTGSLLLAGCGGLLSRTPSRFFTLDRVAPATSRVTATGAPLGIDVVELPPGFDRRDIAVKQADRRVVFREKEQWSGPLEPLVLHTLAFNLAARLPDGMVILPGQPIPEGSKRSIDVVFEELVAGPANRVILDARWSLRDRGTAAVSQHEQIAIDIPSLKSEDIAAGTSQALATLADRMAAELGRR